VAGKAFKRLMAVFLILLYFILMYKEFSIPPRIMELVTYGTVFGMSAYIARFYNLYVRNFADERAQVSYIAAMIKDRKFFVRFEDIKLLDNITAYNPESLNLTDYVDYLGHPPLYYWIMSFTKSIKWVGDSKVTLDMTALRNQSALIGFIGIILAFYIGFRCIKKDMPVFHLFYAVAVTSVPMYLYSIAGVTNDTLTLVFFAIFMLGLIRISEDRFDFLTYILIGVGISGSLLTKLTAGMLVCITAILYVIIRCIKDKSLKVICNKYFFTSLIIYIPAVVYYVYILVTYNKISPTIKDFDPQYFYKSTLYYDFCVRSYRTAGRYFYYYWESYFSTWTGIFAHVQFVKYESLIAWDRIYVILLVLGPIAMFFINKKTKRKYMGFFISGYIAFIIVNIMQFYRAYNTYFYSSGFPGGYQSRYYLCLVPMFALIIVSFMEMIYNRYCRLHSGENRERRIRIRNIITIVVAVMSFMFFYSNFLYFLMGFGSYIAPLK